MEKTLKENRIQLEHRDDSDFKRVARSRIPVRFHETAGRQAIVLFNVRPDPTINHAQLTRALPRPNPTTNSFAATLVVLNMFLVGFVIAAAGITISSVGVAAIGCAVLFGAAVVCGLLLT
jgi:hypothetical protein